MFRSVYIRLLLLMSISLLVLLSVIGAMTYVVFSKRLTADGQADLLSQAAEVTRAIGLYYDDKHSSHEHDPSPHHTMLDDDNGENTFFVVRDHNGHTVMQSASLPVAAQHLTASMNNGFHTVSAGQTDYRVYVTSYHVPYHDGRLWVLQSIVKEQLTLSDISAILWITGGIGGVMVVLLNVWLASRALAPARRTWQTQQDMLLELSHELKTPLATITAIAATTNTPESSRLIREARHATSLLEDILYFARLQSTVGQSVEPVAVSDVTEDTMYRFVPLARAEHMIIRGKASDGVFVMTTVERWSHLVSILCKNATQHGRPNTDIVWSLEETSSSAVFTLTNEKGETKSPQTSASGIGLRIAERLVRDMHGQFELTTTQGRVVTRVTVPKCGR